MEELTELADCGTAGAAGERDELAALLADLDTAVSHGSVCERCMLCRLVVLRDALDELLNHAGFSQGPHLELFGGLEAYPVSAIDAWLQMRAA